MGDAPEPVDDNIAASGSSLERTAETGALKREGRCSASRASWRTVPNASSHRFTSYCFIREILGA